MPSAPALSEAKEEVESRVRAQPPGGGRGPLPRRAIYSYAATAFAVLFLPFWCQLSVEYCIPRGIFACLSYFAVRWRMTLIAYLCLLLPFLFLVLLTRRPWIPALLYGVVGTAAAYANYYKKLYRGDPVLPLDLFYAREAAAISGELSMPFTRQMWVTAGVFAAVLVLLCFVKLPFRPTKRGWLARVGAAAATLAAAFLLYNGTVLDYDAMTGWGYSEMSLHIDTYYANTFYTSFLTLTGEQLITKPPEGYSDQAVEQLAGELAAQAGGARTPDIIEILLESYEDMAPYHTVLEFEDLLEPCAQARAEGVSGSMVTLGYGGGTGNIEYEVLTGFDAGPEMVKTVAFSETFAGYPSLPTYLKGQGYGLFAVHAYEPTLYHRQTAYADLGLDEVEFIDSFQAPELVGEYISDAEMVRKVIQLYEEGIRQYDHVYIHGVSMQNHTPHDTEKLPGEELIPVTGPLSEEQLHQVRNAATLVKLTSAAVEQLVDYFRGSDRDVLIVVYGDHRSMLAGGESGADYLAELGFMDTPNAQVALHQTPYLVWANYKTQDHASYGALSPNLLLPYALQDYDVVAPAYFTLYQESRSSPVKARSGDMVVLQDESIHYAVTPEDLKALSRRHILQYNAVRKRGSLLDVML